MSHFNSSLPDSLSWKQLYQAAILELDHDKLVAGIADARRAIHARANEGLSDSTLTERQALNSALRTLQILEEVAQREKLAACLPVLEGILLKLNRVFWIQADAPQTKDQPRKGPSRTQHSPPVN